MNPIAAIAPAAAAAPGHAAAAAPGHAAATAAGGKAVPTLGMTFDQLLGAQGAALADAGKLPSVEQMAARLANQDLLGEDGDRAGVQIAGDVLRAHWRYRRPYLLPFPISASGAAT